MTDRQAAEGSEEITQLLAAWKEGDQAAVDRLMELVYPELRRLAGSYLRRERAGHTLQTTALVHEAYLKLVEQRLASWENRAQFFALAATLMRRILVDHARRHRGKKRGGGAPKVQLDEAILLAQERQPDLVALDDALRSLAELEPELARLVELRFFGGLTTAEAATVLELSTASVERRWRLARAWLYRQLAAGGEEADG